MGLWMVCRWLLWLTCSCLRLCLCLCLCGGASKVCRRDREGGDKRDR